MIIGIIGAMECEIAYIKDNMNVKATYKKAQMEFYSGVFLLRDIVVVRSGIGKVNASICTQILIDDYKVDVVINVGVAGGILNDICLGDVVVAMDLVQHDVDGSICNYKLGQVPQLKVFSFECSKELVNKTIAVNSDIKEFTIHRGRIITGDQIISSTDKIRFFREQFDPHAVEMESAAIGQTCYLNEVPFLIIRGISDKADEELNTIYDDYEKIAINNSVRVLTNLLNDM